jgi:hypothetical protein
VRTSGSPAPVPRNHVHAVSSPHDGRGITFHQLVGALQNAYNTSLVLAYFLALVGFIACGSGWLWNRTLDLHQLALHNRLEHDASLVHADAAQRAQYAPTTVDSRLLEAFIASAPEDGVDYDALVRYRARREIALGNPFRGWLARFGAVSASEAMAGLDRMQDPQTGKISDSTIMVSDLAYMIE